MLKPCRECDHPVATRAKTCPNCGVKKPTATKLETGLDSSAAWMFKLGLTLCLLFFFVVACGVLAGCSLDDPEPTSTPTTRQTSTTSRPSSSSEQECRAQSETLSVMSVGIGDLLETFVSQSSSGDLVGLQETYSVIEWAMDGFPDAVFEMLAVCEGHVPQFALDEGRSALRDFQSSWADIQRVCRSDLAAFGFEC